MTTHDCQFGENLKCIYCGWQAKNAKTHRRCTDQATPRPIFERVSSYAKALAKWFAAGCPVRTEAQINELLEVHCKPCDRYREGVCSSCGCPVNRKPQGWRNKLAMATEECPRGLFGPNKLTESAQDALGTSHTPVRVGFVLPSLMWGGGEHWHLNLLAALNRREDVAVSGVAFVGPATAMIPDIVQRMAALCPLVASTPFDHVHHVPNPVEAVYAVAQGSDVLVAWAVQGRVLEALKATELPLVGVSHCGGDFWKTEAMSTIKRWVAVSAAACGPIRLAEEVTVIDNGIDIGRLWPTVSWEMTRRQAGIPLNAKVVVSIGRLSAEKRLHLAVEALKYLPSDWHLWLVGDGAREPLEILAKLEGVADRLTISSSRFDVGNVLTAADRVVLLSKAEGYCLAAVEALALGLPLVATPVGILPSLWPGADYLPLIPAPRDIACRLLSRAWPAPHDVINRIHREHSADAMADRWAKYLTEVASANRM